jgi:cytochrome c oxidase assembly protein subunit 15
LLLCALLLQLTLGVSNVVFGLPLPVAVAHNAGAALLLLTTATVVYFTRRSAT